MSIWFEEDFEAGLRVSLRCSRTVFAGQSPFQRVEVFDTDLWGRALALDGKFMTSERDEYFYHERIVHPAMQLGPLPKRVLIIGGGDGGTAREVLRYRCVEKVVMVEIDEMVVDASKEYMPAIGANAWKDPRLEVRIDDGIAYVKESQDAPFDVILLDGTDPIGPAEGLFNEAFYRGCKRMLAPGGVFALQSESPLLFADVFDEIQHTLARLFRHVHPYFGAVPLYGVGMWSWTLASDAVEDPRVPVAGRESLLTGEHKLYSEEMHRGMFAVPNFVAKRLKKC